MPEVQITELAVIVITVCVTIIVLFLIYRAEDGLRFRIDRSGVEFELADDDDDKDKKKPEPKKEEISNETDIA